MDCHIFHLNIVLSLFLLVDHWSLKGLMGRPQVRMPLYLPMIGVNYVASDGQVINLKCLYFVEKKTKTKVAAGM